jgi:hypothetical protein
MGDRRTRSIAIIIAAAHTMLLLAYTLPSGWVPVRLRYWSQAYSRVPFHQDWRLFAPDPPECGCSIVIQDDPDGDPEWMNDLHHGFIWKRMSANACRYAEASLDQERKVVVVGDALGNSLLAMTGRDPRRDGSTIHLMRFCRCRWSGLNEIRFPQTP